MRILYVVFNAPPLHSGRARQALMLADALNREPDVRVWVVSLDQGDTIAPPYPPPLLERLDVWNAWLVWRRVFWLCLRHRVQAVHFHGHNYAAHLALLLRPLGIRVFLHMTLKGFDDPATLLDGRGSRLQRAALRRLSAWVVQNPDDLLPGRHPPVVNIPNAVAPARPRRGGTGARVIVMSGVVCPRKGQLAMLQTFAALPVAVRRGLRLRLAGSYAEDYWEYDTDYVAACRDIADALPEAELLGHLDKEALMEELRGAHYFAAVSQVEGLSNAYLECLSYGLLPIVHADRHDTLFDTLEMGDWLIRVPRLEAPESDAAGAGAALAAALAADPWSEDKAAEVQARVQRYFGLEEIAGRLLTLYRGRPSPAAGHPVAGKP